MVKRTFEEKQNITVEDIYLKMKELSPMLQQEYLENILKRIVIQPNIKVAASKILAELYGKRGLWSSAARVLASAAEAAVSFNDKKEIYMTAGLNSIRALDYVYAEDLFRKAADAASPAERPKIQAQCRTFFLNEAANLEKSGKIAKSIQIYERIMRNTVSIDEKRKLQEKLMPLYEKIGRISDALAIRDALRARF